MDFANDGSARRRPRPCVRRAARCRSRASTRPRSRNQGETGGTHAESRRRRRAPKPRCGAVRRHRAGKPNYEEWNRCWRRRSAGPAESWPGYKQMGPIVSMKFAGVGGGGWDGYDVQRTTAGFSDASSSARRQDRGLFHHADPDRPEASRSLELGIHLISRRSFASFRLALFWPHAIRLRGWLLAAACLATAPAIGRRHLGAREEDRRLLRSAREKSQLVSGTLAITEKGELRYQRSIGFATIENGKPQPADARHALPHRAR